MTKTLYPLHGIVTVLNTPFSTTGDIDYQALQNHVLWALKTGVAGFLVPGMAAEADRLTHAEKLKMVETVVEAVEGAVPVIAGTMAENPESVRSLIKDYIRMGCGNILINLPYTDRETYFATISDLAGLGPDMIMIQDWDAGGYGLPDDLIVELFQTIEPFRCLKIETIPAGAKYSKILALTDHQLNVSGGWAVTQMTEGLERGVHAFMPTGMHAIYVAIYQWWHSGRKQDAEALFRKLLPVIAFSNQHLDLSIRFFKRLLWRQGMYPTPEVRGDRIPFDALHTILADKHIDWVLTMEDILRAESQARNEVPPHWQSDDDVI